MCRSAVSLASVILLCAAPMHARAQRGDIVAASRARYAALQSYADTGVMVVENHPPGAGTIVERHRFVTYYRAPRQFLFDFRRESSGERVAVWCDGGDFNTWWSTTHVHDSYGQGRGIQAFALTSFTTAGAVLFVPPLLFSRAGLHGPLADLAGYGAAGAERLGGRTQYKVVGSSDLTYASGRSSGAHTVTLWIDSATTLVTRMVEETPGAEAGTIVSRVTTTLTPVANPALDAARFHFVIPAAR